MSSTKMLTMAVAAVVVGGMLSACGSAGSADTVGADGTKTVTIGIMTPLTGPASASFGQHTLDAANARIQLANDTNEIPGVKIKLVTQDEGTSVDTSTNALKRLAEQDNALVVLAAGVYFWGSYRYAVQQNIPVVGDCIDGPECGYAENKTIFATFGSSDNDFKSYKGLPEFFKKQGGTSYCGISYDAPSPSANGKAMAGSAAAAGLPVKYTNFAMPRGAADFSSIALSIKQAGCDIVGAQVQVADAIALYTAVKSAGVTLKSTFVQGAYGQELLNDPASRAAAQGLTATSGTMPWSQNTPGVQKMKDALKKYAGWDSPYPAAGFQWGWFTADTAIAGLKKAGKDVTRESFVEALRTVTDHDHDGLTCPVDYSKFGTTSQQFPGNCTWMVKVQDNDFVSITGDDPIHIEPIPGTKNS
ncbi:ABC transporter substrate-binding protein [Arthrobacter sp. 18067]|uniref:ABC transporter substrate-binding protein n=1 Tax=Arthrobacter sp. 18067 TaxID=2681413 RepID=UPI00135C2D5E|nr:ABC transporter substrate-binding protein [Arthrobacter sp. 18067]